LELQHDINFIFKNEPFPLGVAMSVLSTGIKKHASKSLEAIPLTGASIWEQLDWSEFLIDAVKKCTMLQ
jgi:hypothetical protein